MADVMDRYVPLPPFPARISRLNELAHDLWWSWHPRARDVFRDLDYPLWRFTDHNPVLLLHLVEPERLEHAAADPAFLRLYDEALAGLDLVRAGTGTWWLRKADGNSGPIAWITPEFALHQSLPVDASASGVVSADFCKEASDLGLPLVGVGLMYPRGFAHQRLSSEGWQQESYEYIDWSDAPINPALCPDGSPCRVEVPIHGSRVQVAVWRVHIGRVTLYLLDTDLQENPAWDRELSSKYFPDDAEVCLRQAVLLGTAAVRVLERLGIEPSTWHLAEGLGAPVILERLNRMIAGGSELDDGLAAIARSTVAGTREPSPVRRASFSFASIDRHLAATWPALVPHRERVLALGTHEADRGAAFNVTVLAARTAGVFSVPETAAAEPGRSAWQEVRGQTRPAVQAIPDGAHLPSWVSADLARLFDEFVEPEWRDRQDDETAWEAVRRIPDARLWAVRERLRGYLVDYVRERARRKWSREQASGNRLVALGTLLDAHTLTIGFARRFTGSARPDLVFHDVERLAKILTAARRPVQIVFAGKAHVGDEIGKHHLQRVFRHALDPSFGGRVAFLENYDLHARRLLVQGCDVWLSTPRRDCPSSIGGLQAAINGVPHLATADGWWASGWTGDNGWLMEGRGRDAASQDAADAQALYRLLEDEIVPAFYERGRDGLPARWAGIMKASIATTLPRFCARRSVKAYADAAYTGVAHSRSRSAPDV
jgi:glycogen phosphorylase